MPAYVGVIDVQGREVAKLADGPSPAGLHQARLTPLPPGLYFVTLRAGRARLERKLVVLK
jgi:hypothetical protein